MTTRRWPFALVLVAAAAGAAALAEDEKPRRLELGAPVDVELKESSQRRRFVVSVDKRGPYRLAAVRPKPDVTAPCRIRVGRGEDAAHTYNVDKLDRYQFFPVLEKGESFIEAFDGEGVALRVSLERFEPVLGDDDKKSARAAIDKAAAFLEKDKPSEEYTHAQGIEGIVLAALAEGATPERRERLEKDFLPFVEAHMAETPGTWKGEKVWAPAGPIYEAAIVTIGLAEAATGGSAKAKELLPRCVKYLLATQLGPLRCKEWGPVERGSPHAGGWRYNCDSPDADLSASGWCIIALTAATASGVRVEGVRDALHAAVEYALRCADATHFGYLAGGGEAVGDVRSGIGALICLLYGEEPDALQPTLEKLDDRLSSYTRVEDGDDYPLYYAYYATRAHYLRGGYPWQCWRSTMVKQLLAHQRADGAFDHFGSEEGLSERFSTALGSMILRMCLEEVPAYLKREVKGF